MAPPLDTMARHITIENSGIFPNSEMVDRYITPPCSPRITEPPAIKRVLANSGAFDQCEPYLSWSQEELDEYIREQQEDEKNQPWCHYCHPQSGCDGDHGDECRASGGGGPIYRGPAFSPITVPMAMAMASPEPEPEPEPLVIIAQAQETIAECVDEIEAWARSLEALIADSRAIREAPLSAFANLAHHDDDDDVSEPNMDEL